MFECFGADRNIVYRSIYVCELRSTVIWGDYPSKFSDHFCIYIIKEFEPQPLCFFFQWMLL